MIVLQILNKSINKTCSVWITTLIIFFVFINKGYNNLFVLVLSTSSKWDPFKRFHRKSSGPFYLNINCFTLPNNQQVLICLKSNKKKQKAKEKGEVQPFLESKKQLNLFTSK